MYKVKITLPDVNGDLQQIEVVCVKSRLRLLDGQSYRIEHLCKLASGAALSANDYSQSPALLTITAAKAVEMVSEMFANGSEHVLRADDPQAALGGTTEVVESDETETDGTQDGTQLKIGEGVTKQLQSRQKNVKKD